MSIPLRDGFVNETLERVLEDLMVRFVINCPEEDLSSIERVLFQIEEAHWFYQDFLRTLNPLLPSMKMKQFTTKLLEQCPIVWQWGDPSEALSKFGKYKSTIPVRGCALLNTTMDKVLLVKGMESSSWGFPRGKISKDEKDVDCALRELEEETGYDASELIDEDEYVERTIKGKNYKIYIVKGVSEETNFNPKVRFEIADIKWKDIKYLNKAVKTSNNFYLVGAMIKPIISFIKREKSVENEEELKRLATIQLKKILGVGFDEEKKENENPLDPGRALLNMLQSVAKNRQASITEFTQPTMLQNQQQLQQPQLSLNMHPLPMFPQQMFPMPPPTQMPFPLQFVNPFMPLPNMPFNPQFPFAHPVVAQQMAQNLSQMSAGGQFLSAPAASSLSKPQFGLANKRSKESNSKELLSILKSKSSPKSEQAPLLGSHQHLNANAKALSEMFDRKKLKLGNNNNSPGRAIKILKRESSIEETKDRENQQKRTIEKTSNSKVNSYIDITKPANESTNSDIGNFPPKLNGKSVILLKKPSAQADSSNASELLNLLKKKDTTSYELMNNTSNRVNVSTSDNGNNGSNGAVQLLGLLKRAPTKTLPSQQKSPVVSTDLLNLLTNPTEKKGVDPSAELLSLLKVKPQSGKEFFENESKYQSVDNNASKNLLKLLKRPEEVTSAPSRSSDPSSELLSLLKKKPSNTLNAPDNPQQTTPTLSNGKLNGHTNSTTMLSSENQYFSEKGGSSQLLNILHRSNPVPQPINTNGISDSAVLLSRLQSSSRSPQPQKAEPSPSNASNLLSLLKKPTLSTPPSITTSLEPSSNILTPPGCSNVLSTNDKAEANGKTLLNILKNNSAESEKIEPNISDIEFIDFDDLDDGENDDEYKQSSNLLYVDDEDGEY